MSEPNREPSEKAKTEARRLHDEILRPCPHEERGERGPCSWCRWVALALDDFAAQAVKEFKDATKYIHVR